MHEQSAVRVIYSSTLRSLSTASTGPQQARTVLTPPITEMILEKLHQHFPISHFA